MLLSLFLYPLAQMIGEGVELQDGVRIYPVVAPVLIIVGSMMLRNVSRISWEDATEAVPSFLTMTIMPFAFGITEGIAFGFISYALLKTATGKWRDVPGMVHLFAVPFVIRYIFLCRALYCAITAEKRGAADIRNQPAQRRPPGWLSEVWNFK